MMADSWIKVVHVLAVISWMAGLLYLPRLMVYHASEKVDSAASTVFKAMERRLLKAIMRPALVVSLISGFALAGAMGFSFSSPWLALKLVMVVGLVLFHGVLEHYVVLFAADWRGRSTRYFRVLNEVPTILLIGIVIMVVVKPFS
jgi:protoporphyrinogen IX oxidase